MVAFFVPFFVPFFGVANDNIFENGTIDTSSPKLKQVWNADCSSTQHTSSIGGDGAFDLSAAMGICANNAKDDVLNYWLPLQNTTGAQNCNNSVSVNSTTNTINPILDCDGGFYDRSASFNVTVNNQSESMSEECPNDAFPLHTSPYNNSNNSTSCFDPNQANLLDSCNSSSGNEFLNIQVTAAVGCFTQSDGSSCQYNAVDVGGGQSVYEMDLEGDCYSQVLPTLDDNGSLGEIPTGGDSTCNNNGGLLACTENEQIMCPNGECNESCGYVNDSFVCYDVDTDGDGLPDYNDPDIDGDGIGNGDDLDSDGDGQDDPINGNGNNSGGVTDMSGVVSGLGDIKDELLYNTTTTDPDRTKFEGLYGDESKAQLEQDIVDLKEDILAEIESIKTEAQALINITASGSGYEARNLALTQVTLDLSLSRFGNFWVLLSGPVMLVCSVIAAFVILGSKN